MLVDANLLLYAADSSCPQHDRARGWLEAVLNGPQRVGLPWPALLAFVRLSTHPKVVREPLSASQAWSFVDDWLEADNAWIPAPTGRHAAVLGGLVDKYDLRGNLVPDGHLAALALEHGLPVCSSDSDFARFTEIRWVNPLAVG